MSKKLTGLEKNRIAHINFLMKEIHTSTNNVYESFIDKEYSEAKKHTHTLIKRLKEVINSLEDEI